ncbi:hypothetical protein OE88DRAFT_1647173 [Heliocybe sulcata]|uniref:DNA-directed DNA polymerase n=1 Tax=Heliocybe sulcata TaxID=5364 RepID=A0A5C3MWN4_9AGAM|nr:hypothetical protein OE88DRAFT_1647173 [Heliocybe sulcata]
MEEDWDEFFRQQDLVFYQPDETMDYEERLASSSNQPTTSDSGAQTPTDVPQSSSSPDQAKQKDSELKRKAAPVDETDDMQADSEPAKRVRIDTAPNDKSGDVPSSTPELGNRTGSAYAKASGVVETALAKDDSSRRQLHPQSVSLVGRGQDPIVSWSAGSEVRNPPFKAAHASPSAQETATQNDAHTNAKETYSSKQSNETKKESIATGTRVQRKSTTHAMKSDIGDVMNPSSSSSKSVLNSGPPTTSDAKSTDVTQKISDTNLPKHKGASAPAVGSSRQPAATASRVMKGSRSRHYKYVIDEDSTDGSDCERKRAAPPSPPDSSNKQKENEKLQAWSSRADTSFSSPYAPKSAKPDHYEKDPLAEFYEHARAEQKAASLAEDGEENGVPSFGGLKSSEGGFIVDQKGGSSVCVNQDIVDKLSEVMAIHQARPTKDDMVRVQVYHRAIAALKRHPKRITNRDEAVNIMGIGSKTADKIEEIMVTGTLERLKRENLIDVKITSIFLGIYGVGQATAWRWFAMGCRTLKDVLTRAETKKIKLSEVQKIGIKYYDDINDRMPRAEAKEIFDRIKAIALKLDPKLFIEIMGSYRSASRGKADCGDIDILITRPTDDGRTHRGILRKLLRNLHEERIITEDLSIPEDLDDLENVYRGLCRRDEHSRHRRIDFLAVPWRSRGAALLYYTGDDIFNRSMRLKANKMGYSLNQRGLYAGVVRDPHDRTKKISEGNIVASEAEEEIFRILGDQQKYHGRNLMSAFEARWHSDAR